MLKNDGKSYAFWRVQGTFNKKAMNSFLDHDYRNKDSYKSNPDIDISKSINNIYIIKRDNYKKYYNEQIKPLKIQHEKEQINKRRDRTKTFNQYLNSGNSSILETHVFEATKDYFKNSNDEEIIRWANTCMDFLYKELNYKKELVISSVIHIDEATPHLHVTYLPLIYKYDKKKKKYCYTLSKQESIKGKNHLSQLQTIHQQYMIENGFNLERGTIGSKEINLSSSEFKKQQKELEKVNEKNNIIDNKINNIENIIQNFKQVPFNKNNFIISNLEKEKIYSFISSVKENSNGIKEISKFSNKLENIQDNIEDRKSEIIGLKSKVYIRDKAIIDLNQQIEQSKIIISSKNVEISDLKK